MKKTFLALTATFALGLSLTACGSNEVGKEVEKELEIEVEETTEDVLVKVGMMTDSGTIDDKSFNEGTWEGISRFYEDYEGIDKHYLQPNGETTTDYILTAEDLIISGSEIIVAPGYLFGDAIEELQAKYPEHYFVILDGAPKTMTDNTTSIFFAEHQAGFLAGISAALETESGKVGFIGGIKIPPVQKFGWGYVAGVAYANQTFGLNVEVAAYQYEGSFDNIQAGKTIAGGMYDMGIDIIFAAAGGVGNGVITEAQTRAKNGERVFVIGVDSDQYDDGLMEDGTSVILTSAIKRVDNAAYDVLQKFVNNQFPGGQVNVLDAAAGGVGLPAVNPNLSDETEVKVAEGLEKIQSEQITVPESEEELALFLEEMGFDAEGINY